MSKVSSSGLSLTYESKHIRHKDLSDGLMEHYIDIMTGPLPEYIVFFIMDPGRFSNNLKLSSTKMETCGLDQFSIMLDNVEQEHYPLKVVKHGNSKFYHQYYKRWLVMTSTYGDTTETIMDEDTFVECNFMILENFQDFESKSGHLAVKLKFETLLSEKLFFCWMPCTKRELRFDRNLNVQVI